MIYCHVVVCTSCAICHCHLSTSECYACINIICFVQLHIDVKIRMNLNFVVCKSTIPSNSKCRFAKFSTVNQQQTVDIHFSSKRYYHHFDFNALLIFLNLIFQKIIRVPARSENEWIEIIRRTYPESELFPLSRIVVCDLHFCENYIFQQGSRKVLVKNARPNRNMNFIRPSSSII